MNSYVKLTIMHTLRSETCAVPRPRVHLAASSPASNERSGLKSVAFRYLRAGRWVLLLEPRRPHAYWCQQCQTGSQVPLDKRHPSPPASFVFNGLVNTPCALLIGPREPPPSFVRGGQREAHTARKKKMRRYTAVAGGASSMLKALDGGPCRPRRHTSFLPACLALTHVSFLPACLALTHVWQLSRVLGTCKIL